MYERNIEWKACPNPKENAMHASSFLTVFIGANVMSVYEVAEALDISKERVAKLYVSMDTIRDNVASEFRKDAMTTKCLHK
jgi:hypothetical protein